MNALPVVDRELRTAARRAWTYRVRCLFALSGLAAYAIVMGFADVHVQNRGAVLLRVLSVGALVYCLLAGSFVTADCISAEKRSGTLGLLLLTPLRSLDVALGKLAAHGLQALVGFLAILPLFFLPILEGGVTWAETLRVWLALFLALAWSLSLGLLFSALGHDARSTVMGSLVTMALLTVLPLLYSAVTNHVLSSGPPITAVMMVSPAWLLTTAYDSMYLAFRGSYWSAALLTLGLTVSSTLLACRVLRRSWRDDASNSPDPRPASQNVTASLSLPFTSKPPRRVLHVVGGPEPAHPYQVRLLRAMGFPGWFAGFHWLVLGLVTVMLLAVPVVPSHSAPACLIIAMLSAFALNLGIRLFMGVEAVRLIHADRTSGAFELLLTTPDSDAPLRRSLTLALYQTFRGPMKTCVLVNLALIVEIVIFSGPLSISSREFPPFLTMFAGGLLASLADARAIRWAGVVHALTQASAMQATLRTLALVLIPGWLALGVVAALVSATGSASTAAMLFMVYYLVAVFYDDAVVGWSRRRLARGLRALLTEPRLPESVASGTAAAA